MPASYCTNHFLFPGLLTEEVKGQQADDQEPGFQASTVASSGSKGSKAGPGPHGLPDLCPAVDGWQTQLCNCKITMDRSGCLLPLLPAGPWKLRKLSRPGLGKVPECLVDAHQPPEVH